MISPVSLSRTNVHFGENVDLSAPGKFTLTSSDATADDSFKLSPEAAEKENKKNKVLKGIGGAAGSVIVLAAGLFGIYKWKGEKWKSPDGNGIMATIKKYIVKPGEKIDDLFKRVKEKFSKTKSGSQSEETLNTKSEDSNSAKAE